MPSTIMRGTMTGRAEKAEDDHDEITGSKDRGVDIEACEMQAFEQVSAS